ncbi:MAG: helix-turn-helix domain-containing protein [Oscillospiraceae bacterium]|nr:helix-turn-helix domain-containing protein [Oscillospiraceae bacterium]
MSNIGNNEILAKNLTKYVEESGKTRSEICADLGIAYSTFSEWMNGRKYPRIDKIEMMANYFGIMKSDLIEEHSAADLSALSSSDFNVMDAPTAFVRIPVIGKVAAGTACLAETNIDEYITCDASLINDGYDYCYLRVKGDSMDPLIREGDLVLVRIQDQVDSGTYAVVIVDDENGLVKKVELSKTQLSLISENPYYPPRTFVKNDMNRVHIFGLVVEVRRRFV